METPVMLLSMEELARYQRALAFAQEAHGDQTRRYTRDPYWMHLVAVAKTVAAVPGRSMEMIEAALLHDTLEDTAVRGFELSARFGVVVRRLVAALTDPPLAAGNRTLRKALVRARLQRAGYAVKTIKLADLLDNTETIVAYDPSFARVYMREKAELLPALVGGDPRLWQLAQARVTEYERDLHA